MDYPKIYGPLICDICPFMTDEEMKKHVYSQLNEILTYIPPLEPDEEAELQYGHDKRWFSKECNRWIECGELYVVVTKLHFLGS